MNKKGFTLIEVLVSITILAVVATGLFQISINSKNNFAFLNKKAKFDRLASIPLMHNNPKFHHKEQDLYQFLRYDYDIKEDEIRQYLKKNKITYTQEEYSTFSPMGEEEEQNDALQNSAGNIAQSFTFVYDKITIFNKKQSTYVYKIYMRE